MYVFICIVIGAFSFLFLHKKKKLFENHTNQSNFEICPILLYIVYIYIAVLTVLGTTFKPLRFCQPLKLCYNAHTKCIRLSIYLYLSNPCHISMFPSSSTCHPSFWCSISLYCFIHYVI